MKVFWLIDCYKRLDNTIPLVVPDLSPAVELKILNNKENIMCVCVCVCVCVHAQVHVHVLSHSVMFDCVSWTVACQAPLSMKTSRQ